MFSPLGPVLLAGAWITWRDTWSQSWTTSWNAFSSWPTARNSPWVLLLFFGCCFYEDDTVLVEVSVMKAQRRDGVGRCVNLLGTCMLKTMLRYGTLSWKLLHVINYKITSGVLAFPTLASWRRCYATARCLGSCFMSSMIKSRELCWRSWHMHFEDDATIRHVVLEVASCHPL